MPGWHPHFACFGGVACCISNGSGARLVHFSYCTTAAAAAAPSLGACALVGETLSSMLAASPCVCFAVAALFVLYTLCTILCALHGDYCEAAHSAVILHTLIKLLFLLHAIAGGMQFLVLCSGATHGVAVRGCTKHCPVLPCPVLCSYGGSGATLLQSHFCAHGIPFQHFTFLQCSAQRLVQHVFCTFPRSLLPLQLRGAGCANCAQCALCCTVLNMQCMALQCIVVFLFAFLAFFAALLVRYTAYCSTVRCAA